MLIHQVIALPKWTYTEGEILLIGCQNNSNLLQFAPGVKLQPLRPEQTKNITISHNELSMCNGTYELNIYHIAFHSPDHPHYKCDIFSGMLLAEDLDQVTTKLKTLDDIHLYVNFTPSAEYVHCVSETKDSKPHVSLATPLWVVFDIIDKRRAIINNVIYKTNNILSRVRSSHD